MYLYGSARAPLYVCARASLYVCARASQLQRCQSNKFQYHDGVVFRITQIVHERDEVTNRHASDVAAHEASLAEMATAHQSALDSAVASTWQEAHAELTRAVENERSTVTSSLTEQHRA